MRGAGRKALCTSQRGASPSPKTDTRITEDDALPRAQLTETRASRGATRTAALTSCITARGKWPFHYRTYKIRLSVPGAEKVSWELPFQALHTPPPGEAHARTCHVVYASAGLAPEAEVVLEFCGVLEL